MKYFSSGSQISPCIYSKARYALKLTDKTPVNTKLCSWDYWRLVIDLVSKDSILNKKEIEKIKEEFHSYIPKIISPKRK